jgi:HlyD family secretion protein
VSSLSWLCGCVLLIVAGCGSRKETIKPTVGSITESVYASGIVKSRSQYQAYATVTGIVEHVAVRDGDLVKRGQPILRLRNIAAKLTADNARLSAEYAELKRNLDKLNEARLGRDFARSKLINDSLLMERQRNLINQNVGSRVEWEQRQLAYQNSRTAYESAEIRYRELSRQLDLTARQAKVNFEISEQQAQDFTITSKVDGRVYAILREVGELVTPQTPVAVIGEADHFLLELQIDETDIVRIKPGQRTVVTLSSYPERVWEALVTHVNPIMNERSKLFTVEAEWVEPPPSLYPNLTVEANIVIAIRENVMTLPRSFLESDSTVRLDNNELRKVKVGLRDYQRVEILGGLAAEDVVVRPGS